MRLTITRDAEEFTALTKDLFDGRLECNLHATVLRGVLDGQYADSSPLFVYGAPERGEVAFAALRIPPWPMLVTELEDASAADLVRAWLKRDPELPGVQGLPGAARPIAAAWEKATRASVRLRVREGVHVLEQVHDPPRPAAGMLRLPRADERPLVVRWMIAFAREVGGGFPESQAEPLVDARLGRDGLWFWDDGGPVSLVGTAPSVAGVVRIGPVYTPPDQRRRGYAGTAVAAASRQALHRGAGRCTLFTDLENPTSNKIYAEVGYRRVGDWEDYAFE